MKAITWHWRNSIPFIKWLVKQQPQNCTWRHAFISKTQFGSLRHTALTKDICFKGRPWCNCILCATSQSGSEAAGWNGMGGEGWVKTCLPEINPSKPANRKLNFSVRQNKNTNTDTHSNSTDINVLNMTSYDEYDKGIGKFEFIANYCTLCTVQFNSIVSGLARERCRMCDRNPTEFSYGADFSSETKRFFPQELWVCFPRRARCGWWPFSFVPQPPLINAGNPLKFSFYNFASRFSDSSIAETWNKIAVFV